MYNTNINQGLSNKTFNKNVFPWLTNPFQLWSLMDILRAYAESFISLGQLFGRNYYTLYTSSPNSPLTDEGRDKVKRFLSLTKAQCKQLNLTVSEAILSKAINNPPESHRELEILMNVVKEEISSQLFLFVPSHRVNYYEWGNDFMLLEDSFPEACKELERAGKCYAVGEYTACVFHSMRAAEIGLRTLAVHLNVTFPHEITLAEWNALINKCDHEIKEQQQLPKSEARDEELKFCSEAASQFRYFKNAYRIFVAHARESYGEDQALSIMTRTKEFIESLSSKLKES